MTQQVKVMTGVVVSLALVLVVLVVVLVTTGGSNGSDGATPAPTTAAPTAGSTSSGASRGGGDTAPVPAGLDQYYHQSLTWGHCPSSKNPDAECSKLTVPIDYADPSGQSIQLKLERVQATDQSARVGSLVVNPGGPGAPGTSMTEDASYFFSPALLAREDIVAFDPRGTGESDPIDCLSDADLTAFLALDPSPDDAAEGQALQSADANFFAGCKKNSDALAGHITTVEAAKDMDVLRSALAEPTLDYLGFSYGTKLGATYATLFPTDVGRFVLDGAVDPALNYEKAALVQAGGFETALRAYVQHCLDGGGCFLGDSMDAALKTITDLLDSVDQKPLPTSDGRTLTVGSAFYGIITPLYNKDNWTYLDQGLQTALNGDGSTLMLLADSYASRNPDGSYTDNSAEAFPAISCLDDPSSITADQVPSKIPEFEKASPTFGETFAWALVGCYGIQDKAEQPQPTIDGKGAPPILVLGTTRDPATPLSEAVSLAKELASGLLITRDGDGHTAYNKGNSCIDGAVEGYLLDGTVPQTGLQC